MYFALSHLLLILGSLQHYWSDAIGFLFDSSIFIHTCMNGTSPLPCTGPSGSCWGDVLPGEAGMS